MKLQPLLCFVEIARSGSFTRAAKGLAIAQLSAFNGLKDEVCAPLAWCCGC